MAPHSSTLAWKVPWTEEPGGLVHGVAGSRTQLSDFIFPFHFSLSCIGEGNGNPLQCSCLENPRDGGAWWTAISGIAQSRTWLKRLSSSSSSSSSSSNYNRLFLSWKPYLEQVRYLCVNNTSQLYRLWPSILWTLLALLPTIRNTNIWVRSWLEAGIDC